MANCPGAARAARSARRGGMRCVAWRAAMLDWPTLGLCQGGYLNTESRPSETGESDDEGVYCMRCRARRPLERAQRAVLRNGRPVLKGVCPVCQAPLFRIGLRVRRPG